MNDQDVHAVLDELVPRLDDRVGDWNQVLAASALPTRAEFAAPAHGRAWRPPPRLLATAGVIGAALVIALSVTSFWHGGPSVLQRAAAAITGPTSTQVLYENITIHERAASASRGAVAKVQLWFAGGSSRDFRLTVRGSSAPVGVEVGGTIGEASGLSYSAANNVLLPVPFPFEITQSELDPTAFVRAALKAGQAHLDGTTNIAGRSVLNIVIDSRLSGRLVATAHYYVDAHSYEPVRVVIDSVVPNASPLAFPLASITALPYGRLGGSDARTFYTYDFDAFRQLPATAANLKLTDLKAEHPEAKTV